MFRCRTMETQRRGAQNTATLHYIPASYGCLWIEILITVGSATGLFRGSA